MIAPRQVLNSVRDGICFARDPEKQVANVAKVVAVESLKWVLRPEIDAGSKRSNPAGCTSCDG
ncbi:MAG: hypothetical protein CMM01_06950 [Rhodopirellula sp.]|nr:hypothetical protein [Rhodopirellula sp.]OUX51885.1 MAG: hypothetical protein CBE43_02300 [Rhodopirellula sp. TMED283]